MTCPNPTNWLDVIEIALSCFTIVGVAWAMAWVDK